MSRIASQTLSSRPGRNGRFVARAVPAGSHDGEQTGLRPIEQTKPTNPLRARNLRRFKFSRRAGGVLMHLTSLPGPHGSGDLGPDAYRFADFFAAAGQRWWQMLPVGPPGVLGNSPYSSYSAFAGSPWLVSLEMLARDGLLNQHELFPARPFSDDEVLYPQVNRFRESRLRRAFVRFRRDRARWADELQAFRLRSRHWLDDFTCFSALKHKFGNRPWIAWPRPLRLRDRVSMSAWKIKLADEIAFHEFVQFQFDRQWNSFKQYCNERDIGLIGDIPIFVDFDSCDVWAHPELFQLDATGRPCAVTGCPPDDFNPDGQAWRHPHYNWEAHARSEFAWWVSRFALTMTQFDAVRIDHFLGMHRLWSIPPRHKTARKGEWIAGPGAPLFDAIKRELGDVPIIAEDLGAVTKQAMRLRDQYKFPGMRVLQFGFGDGDYNLPHTYIRRCVAYPGTHDNDTFVGWFRKASLAERRKALEYLDTPPRDLHWQMIRSLMSSVADTVILPTQDLLGLGEAARMNVPGTAAGNWRWRLKPGALTPQLAKRLRRLAKLYGRI